jgi:hypothetical protein
VLWDNGLPITVMYPIDDPEKLAGTIRGWFFVIKGEY